MGENVGYGSADIDGLACLVQSGTGVELNRKGHRLHFKQKNILILMSTYLHFVSSQSNLRFVAVSNCCEQVWQNYGFDRHVMFNKPESYPGERIDCKGFGKREDGPTLEVRSPKPEARSSTCAGIQPGRNCDVCFFVALARRNSTHEVDCVQEFDCEKRLADETRGLVEAIMRWINRDE